MNYSPPEHLQPSHKVENFDCGEASLNEWLARRALKSEEAGAARTYVVCWDGEIAGYYCLATGSIIRTAAPGKIKRNMPDPIPVMVLGRLAVDVRHQNKGIGKALVRDAVLRTLQASEIAGIRAILVQAIDEKAKQFYTERCGFVPSSIHPLTLMVTLGDIKNRLGLS